MAVRAIPASILLKSAPAHACCPVASGCTYTHEICRCGLPDSLFRCRVFGMTLSERVFDRRLSAFYHDSAAAQEERFTTR